MEPMFQGRRLLFEVHWCCFMFVKDHQKFLIIINLQWYIVQKYQKYFKVFSVSNKDNTDLFCIHHKNNKLELVCLVCMAFISTWDDLTARKHNRRDKIQVMSIKEHVLNKFKRQWKKIYITVYMYINSKTFNTKICRTYNCTKDWSLAPFHVLTLLPL